MFISAKDVCNENIKNNEIKIDFLLYINLLVIIFYFYIKIF
jgi:hypothetical protein